MKLIHRVIVLYFCFEIYFAFRSVYGFVELIPIFDTAANDLIYNYFYFKVVIFSIGIIYFFRMRKFTFNNDSLITIRAKYLGQSFFLFSICIWSFLFIKYFLSGFPLSSFNKNIYDEMGNLFVLYNLSSIGCLFFIYRYINLKRIGVGLGLLLFLFCVLLSLKLSRIALITNVSTFVFLWFYFQKISFWKKSVLISILFLFVISFNINFFINLRSEASSGNTSQIQISPASIIDLYLGSPRYQAKLGEVHYTVKETLYSIIAPVPVVFREFSNTHVNSVDKFNYSIYSNYVIKDQVPMFYFDLFRTSGWLITIVFWIIFLLILYNISNTVNYWSVFITFKLLLFTIFSFEGIMITLLNDILPYYILHYFFSVKKS